MRLRTSSSLQRRLMMKKPRGRDWSFASSNLKSELELLSSQMEPGLSCSGWYSTTAFTDLICGTFYLFLITVMTSSSRYSPIISQSLEFQAYFFLCCSSLTTAALSSKYPQDFFRFLMPSTSWMGYLNSMQLISSPASCSNTQKAPYLFLRKVWYSPLQELFRTMSAHCPVVSRQLVDLNTLASLLVAPTTLSIVLMRDSSSAKESMTMFCEQPGRQKVRMFSVSCLFLVAQKLLALTFVRTDLMWNFQARVGSISAQLSHEGTITTRQVVRGTSFSLMYSSSISMQASLGIFLQRLSLETLKMSSTTSWGPNLLRARAKLYLPEPQEPLMTIMLCLPSGAGTDYFRFSTLHWWMDLQAAILMSFIWLMIISCLDSIKDHRNQLARIWCWWMTAPSLTGFLSIQEAKCQFSSSRGGISSMKVSSMGCSLLLVCFIRNQKGFPRNSTASTLFYSESKIKFLLVFMSTHSPGILFTMVMSCTSLQRRICHPIFQLNILRPFSWKQYLTLRTGMLKWKADSFSLGMKSLFLQPYALRALPSSSKLQLGFSCASREQEGASQHQKSKQGHLLVSSKQHPY